MIANTPKTSLEIELRSKITIEAKSKMFPTTLLKSILQM